MTEEERVEELIDQQIGQEEREEGVLPAEQAYLLSQIYYLLKDDLVLNEIVNDKDYRKLLPGLSHLNRTSNTDKRSAKLGKLRLKRAIDLILMTKDEADITCGEAVKVDALLTFIDAANDDRVSGWRGKLTTERIRTYKVESGSGGKKRKWIF